MKVADLFASLGLRPVRAEWNAGQRLIGAVKSALVGIIAIKTAQFFGDMIHDVSKTADEFRKMSQSTGVASETLQELSYVAGLSGTDIDTVQKSFNKLSKAMYDAAHGSKMQREVFRDMGISFKDANGNLRATDEVFEEVAERFAKMPDGPKKTGEAMALFGKSGAKLIPMLNQGKEGLAELRQEAIDLGIVVADETGKAFEQFNDDTDRLKTALTGLKTQAVSALLPQLQELITKALAWVKANRDLIKQKLSAVLRILIKMLKLVGKGLDLVADAMIFLEEHATLVKAALIALAAYFVIVQLKAVAAAIAATAAWIAAALPFVAIAAAVVALIALFIRFKDKIAAIGRWFKGLWDDTIEFWKDVWQGFVDWVTNKIKSIPGYQTAKKIAGKIGSLVDTGSEFARRTIAETGGAIGGAPSASVNAGGLPRPTLSPVAEAARRAAPSVTIGETNITIHAAPGMDEERLLKKTEQMMNENWNKKMRNFAAASTE